MVARKGMGREYCWVTYEVMVAMLVGRHKIILYYMLLYLPTKMAVMFLSSESQGID